MLTHKQLKEDLQIERQINKTHKQNTQCIKKEEKPMERELRVHIIAYLHVFYKPIFMIETKILIALERKVDGFKSREDRMI